MTDNDFCFRGIEGLTRELNKKPLAAAVIKGSAKYPNLKGVVIFYKTSCGILVWSEAIGLPTAKEECDNNIFALHIHEGNKCSGNIEDPFADVKTHYNPSNCPHPYHAGDLLPLFSSDDGYAFSLFLTDRFNIDEIITKAVVVHLNRDDFTTQPSGNSGEKIACGIIKSL